MLAAPLDVADVPDPIPGPGEVLIRVSACGVCHTELDEIEGRTPPPILPVILGHQVVGRVVQCGPRPTALKPGARVGVGWIYSACGHCQVLPPRVRKSLPVVPGDGAGRQRRLCRADGGPAGLRVSDSGKPDDRRRGGAAALRRRDWLPLAAPGEPPQWRPTRPHGVRRLGPPRPEARAAPRPGRRGLRLRPKRGRAGLRQGVGRRVGRRHDRHAAGASRRDHRHDARVEPGRGGPAEPGARRPARDQRHP